MWKEFIDISFSWPVIVFTVLYLVCMGYWLVAAFGMIDMDILGVDANFDMDVDAGGDSFGEAMAGLMLKLGLAGVPITITITIISLFGYGTSYTLAALLGSSVENVVLIVLIGIVNIAASLFAGLMVARGFAKLIAPLMAKNKQISAKSIQGQTAVVVTSKVTPTFGEAKLEDGGAGLQLKIRAPDGNGFSRGDKVVLLEFVEADHAWRVILESEFTNI